MSGSDQRTTSAPKLFDALLAGEAGAVDDLNPGDKNVDQPSPLDAGAETTSPDDEPSNGRLHPEARRALVVLMRQGVVMEHNKRLQFESLCRHQAAITAHLSDMYLHLLIDEKAGLAILQQQELNGEDDEDEPTALIDRRTLSLYDTLLLLVVRKHYQERQTAGEQRVLIDVDQIEAQLTPFLTLTQSSRSDRMRLNGALTKMKERRLLVSVRGEDERFEVTPVIRYVVNAEFLEQLLAQYEKMASEAGLTADE